MTLSIRGLRKRFVASGQVLDGITLQCKTGEVCAVIGPSGCGKTTLLNIVAGLELPDGAEALDIPHQGHGAIAYMLQDATLLPWRTLEENASLGVEVLHGHQPSQSELEEYLNAFGLWEERHKYPAFASGGMRQRVSLVRTLLLQAPLLLLDEPFANLDFETKLKNQEFLLGYQRARGTTILWVTHDIEDAIAMSHIVFVLSNKPAVVRAVIPISLGLPEPNPIEARKAPRFGSYFADIWDHLKYTGDGYAR